MTFLSARRLLVWFVLALLVSSAAAAQNVMPLEAQLQTQIAQNPRLVSTYLDLAKLYLDQKRYGDAEQVLQRALSLVQTERGLAGQTTARVMTGVESGPGSSVYGIAPVRVGGDITPPAKLKNVNPVYPAAAMADHIEGIVILEATIGLDGSVENAKVLKSIPQLDQAALDAVRQWQFTPTLKNGSPVPVIMTVTVNFSLK
jgi:TonB family protein